MTSVHLDVYDTTNSTLQRTLTDAYDIQFLDDLTIPGFATFAVDAAATDDLDACRPRRIVRFRTGASAGEGDIFAAIIQDRPAQLSDDVQPEGNLSTVRFECRGLLAWLGTASEGGAVLYPAGGLSGRQQNPRLFGWQTVDFDDSEWDTVSGGRVGAKLSTSGWPDPDAAGFEPVFEGDRALYRRQLPALNVEDTSARMYLAATVSTAVTVWLDGQLVLQKPAGRTGLFFEDVPYDDVDHQLAVEVSGGTGRWGWCWVSTDVETDDDGNEQVVPGEVLRRTYDPDEFSGTPWKVWEAGPDGWQQAGYEPGDEWAEPIADGELTTEGWPDDDAVAYFAQSGRGRYLRQLESDTGYDGATITVVGQFSLSVRVFVDGEQVGYKPAGKSGLFEFDVDYPGEDFVLSVVTVGTGRWGLTWRQSDGTVIRRTYDPAVDDPDEPWLYSPDDWPGVTTGFVLKTALDEDAERYSRPWTYSFDGDAGSDDVAWNVQFSRGFRVQEVGLLVDELVSIEGEPEMEPDGTFRWVVSRGSDKVGTVTVDSPFSLNLSGRGPTATRWLFETQDGFGQVVSRSGVADYGTMERFVQLGSDISSTSIGQVAAAQLAVEAQPQDEVEVGLPDDVEPYETVVLGDTVTCVGRDGTGPVRLTSFTGTVSAAGRVEWTATAVPV